MSDKLHIDHCFTVAEVAEHLCLSTRSIHRLITNGDLAVYRIGRAIRIPQSSINAFLAACRSHREPRE
jgi:excisionase family DNA binding protein